MKMTVLGFTLSQPDKAHIVRMLIAMGITTPVSIIDTRTTNVDLSNTDVLITLGKKAIAAVRPLLASQRIPHIVLPEIKKLYPIEEGGEIEARQEATDLLKQLKASIQTGQFISEEDNQILKSIQVDDLPDFTIGNIQQLEQRLEQTEKLYWRCTTKSGKILCISGRPLEKIQLDKISADIYITFSELIALRAAMDVFKINEVTFAQNNKICS